MALEAITFWHWWALGGLLMFVELFASGFFFLWLGAAAGLVGLALIGWSSMPPTFQLLLFAILAFSSLLAWRRFVQAAGPAGDGAQLNQGAARLVGRRALLSEPLEHGRGRIRLGDSSWPVTGPDLPIGSVVEVVGVSGTVLEVRACMDARPEVTPSLASQASGSSGGT